MKLTSIVQLWQLISTILYSRLKISTKSSGYTWDATKEPQLYIAVLEGKDIKWAVR